MPGKRKDELANRDDNQTPIGGVPLDHVYDLVDRLVPAARDLSIHPDDEYLSFWYEDRDTDLLEVRLAVPGAGYVLGIAVVLIFEEDDFFGVLAASNSWNWDNYPHKSSSVVLSVAGGNAVFLRSSLPTKTGVAESIFEEWVNTFLESIDSWEDEIFSTRQFLAEYDEKETVEPEFHDTTDDDLITQQSGDIQHLEAINAEPDGEPLMARLGAGLEAGFSVVAPFLARAAGVVGDALLDNLADNLRGTNQPTKRRRSSSTQYHQRAGQNRQRSTKGGQRLQRRGK